MKIFWAFCRISWGLWGQPISKLWNVGPHGCCGQSCTSPAWWLCLFPPRWLGLFRCHQLGSECTHGLLYTLRPRWRPVGLCPFSPWNQGGPFLSRSELFCPHWRFLCQDRMPQRWVSGTFVDSCDKTSWPVWSYLPRGSVERSLKVVPWQSAQVWLCWLSKGGGIENRLIDGSGMMSASMLVRGSSRT